MQRICVIFPVVIALFIVIHSAFAGPKCKDNATPCVGLVTDVGVIDDKSFNQSAWEGAKKAATSMGAKIKYIETRDAKDYMSNISLFAENGYDVIITVGFALGEATIKSAEKYPKIKFIGVDQFQAKKVPNVAGLIFHEDRAGFMAGALAAMLSKSDIIAAVLATDMIPPVVAFKKGYEKGARHITPGIKIISTFHPGGLDVAFTDPEWGASTAKQAIAQGADVVFAAGGLTGNGGLMEVAAHKGKYCIGVDTDQWLTLPASRNCLVSCALKLITPAVYDLITMAAENKFPSGNFFGEVGLSPFHDFDAKIPEKVKEKLADIQKDLRTGAIK
ncbi:MAG: BMP family ABC transporter substrate-binding protein [Desulfobacterales bacterium]|nr:BMP family ABC transporter substrate-binding protein [Desulfobacterales bacterium]